VCTQGRSSAATMCDRRTRRNGSRDPQMIQFRSRRCRQHTSVDHGHEESLLAMGKGFWSYVHSDDDAERGRIARLAQDVVSQYQMITTTPIELFLDRDKVEWGEEWRPKIDMALAEVAFFIPIITPRYFLSHECRREFNFFARKAVNLGIKELVMPIRYMDFPSLHDDPCTDELIELARSFQWAEWTELRFSSVDSPEYRQGVANLATRLADASAMLETIAVRDPAVELADNQSDDAPGYLDKLSRAEEAMPKWAETVELIGAKIAELGEAMQEVVPESTTAQEGTFTDRVAFAHKVAEVIENPVNDIRDLANQFSAQLHDVDLGIRAIIERAPAEVETQPAMLPDIESFFGVLRELIASAEEGLGAVEEVIRAIEPAEQASRKLRPVVRTLRKALLAMLDGRDVMRTWAGELDRLPPPLGTRSV
jgi:hypothetical protein